jgi:hypothetical protein
VIPWPTETRAVVVPPAYEAMLRGGLRAASEPAGTVFGIEIRTNKWIPDDVILLVGPREEIVGIVKLVESTHTWHGRKFLPERHGQRCRIAVKGRGRSALVEFADGYRTMTSVALLRRIRPAGREEVRGE